MLLATSFAWSLDVAFFVILAVGLAIGTARGFVKGVCKLAGTVFSVIFAFFFCMPLHDLIDQLFSLSTLIGDAIGSAQVGGWITIAISFLILVILVKLGTWLIGTLGKALVGKSKALSLIDRLLGGILGLAEAMLLILILLMICNWTAFDAVNAFISESTVVKAIYESQWFLEAINLPGKLLTGA